MARTLAEGRLKWTILTAAPADPAAPTATELNAGFDLSCDVLASDFNWTNTASETVDEKALCAVGNSVVFGASNYDLGATLWRQFNPETDKAAAVESEEAWLALREKGTTVWGYARETSKLSTEDWAAGDEIYLGGEIITDAAQRIDGTGFIKRRIVLGAQRMYEHIEVAGA